MSEANGTPEGATVLAYLTAKVVVMPGQSQPTILLSGCHDDLFMSLSMLEDMKHALMTYHAQKRQKEQGKGLTLPTGPIPNLRG